MSYYRLEETQARIEKVREILREGHLDAALIYYDELNIANGWYLTGWCPQFEKGAVLLPLKGDPLLLGGPESEPFAKMSSAITATRNFTPFMVPDEEYPNATISTFDTLSAEFKKKNLPMANIGIVGTAALPHNVFTQFEKGFSSSKLVDITAKYESLRAHKSPWEIENMRAAFGLCLDAYKAMKKVVRPGTKEYEVAAEGEYVCRRAGANSFAFSCIVGSGERAKAVVPTALNKEMKAGELVIVGIAPRINGYAGVVGDTLPVSGTYTPRQKDCMNYLHEAFRLTKAMLKPGMKGREIDVPARKSFIKHQLIDYLVCPFAHTVGLMEAEGPFYGPNSDDVLAPGMIVSVDVSFFGHPEFHGARIETGYVITEAGCEALSPEMDGLLSGTWTKEVIVIGKRKWVFADGDLPPHPEGTGEPKAHEALMVVNASEAQASLRITLLFENSAPKEGLALRVPAKRVSCFRMDQPIWGSDYLVPFGQYALILESDIPVVAVFGRLDRRKDMAYYPVAPYAE